MYQVSRYEAPVAWRRVGTIFIHVIEYEMYSGEKAATVQFCLAAG